MNLLAFETSSQQGSVAIQVDGKVTEKFMRSSKQQTRDLLPLTKTLLTDPTFFFGTKHKIDSFLSI